MSMMKTTCKPYAFPPEVCWHTLKYNTTLSQMVQDLPMRRCRNVKSVPVAGYTFATMSLCHMNTHKTQKIFMSVEMLERDRESMLKVPSILQSSTCKYPPAHQTAPKNYFLQTLGGSNSFFESYIFKKWRRIQNHARKRNLPFCPLLSFHLRVKSTVHLLVAIQLWASGDVGHWCRCSLPRWTRWNRGSGWDLLQSICGRWQSIILLCQYRAN